MSLSLPWQLINIISINRYEIWVINMMQKVGQTRFKKRRFHNNRSTKTDSRLSVEQI